MNAPMSLVVGSAVVPLPARLTEVSVHPSTRAEFVDTLRALVAVPGASEPKNSRVALCTSVTFRDERLDVTVYASPDMKVGIGPLPPVPGMANLDDAIAEAVES